MIVVDTSVLSGALGRKAVRPASVEGRALGAFKRLLRSKTRLGIPGIVMQELLSRVSDAEMFARLRVRLQGLEVLLAGEHEHVLAAEIANDCLRRGVTAATVDCLIAATTISVPGELLSTDPDFADIARCSGLRLIEI